jgi:hypothetical protein
MSYFADYLIDLYIILFLMLNVVFLLMISHRDERVQDLGKLGIVLSLSLSVMYTILYGGWK